VVLQKACAKESDTKQMDPTGTLPPSNWLVPLVTAEGDSWYENGHWA